MAACQCSEGRGGFGGGLHAGGGGTVASCSPVKNGKVSGPQTNAVSSWFLGVCFLVFLQIVKIGRVVMNWKCIYN